WISFLSILLRFALTTMAALVLIATTSFTGICAALERLGMPDVLATQLLLLYRYLLVLGEETMRMARARALRLFDFDFRFEAFVPEAKRQYGYYVLPILEGEALVGRLDPKFHRERGVLEIKGLWFEKGVRATKARKAAVARAAEALAARIGAKDVDWI
ncbi:MAG: hypothetical protein HGA66_19220, partial [Holophaga sp.]|nr:hypothetical protein [Holophaga sp.]